MRYYLYNPLANNGIKPKLPEGVKIIEVLGLDYEKFFSELFPSDEVVLVGGDGTINYLINAVDTEKIKNKIFYIPAGNANDFTRDIKGEVGKEILINDYLKGLPTITMDGMQRKFANGAGYGLDGYCCEVAEQLKKETPGLRVDYTSIAIKGLLFHFKPHVAKVTVDGKQYNFKHVWIASTMKGRFYGGGMMMAPTQERTSRNLTLIVYKTPSKLKALVSFPSIFAGTHIDKKNLVEVIHGRRIEVEFSRPCAIQIDGEPISNIKGYTVVSE